MRTALLLLALAAAAAGAWWLLAPPSRPASDELLVGPSAGSLAGQPAQQPLRASAPAGGLEAAGAAPLPRVGVVDPAEGRPLPDPQAGPWEVHPVRPARKEGQPLSGSDLLDAIGERLYVRVRQPSDLAALRALQLDTEQGEMPLGSALLLLESQGWKWSVMDPRVIIYPAAEAERAGAREASR